METINDKKDLYIRKNAMKKTIKEIAEHLDLRYRDVYGHLYRNDIQHLRSGKMKIAKADQEYLKECSYFYTVRELSNQLNKDRETIEEFLEENNLTSK